MKSEFANNRERADHESISEQNRESTIEIEANRYLRKIKDIFRTKRESFDNDSDKEGRRAYLWYGLDQLFRDLSRHDAGFIGIVLDKIEEYVAPFRECVDLDEQLSYLMESYEYHKSNMNFSLEQKVIDRLEHELEKTDTGKISDALIDDIKSRRGK